MLTMQFIDKTYFPIKSQHWSNCAQLHPHHACLHAFLQVIGAQLGMVDLLVRLWSLDGELKSSESFILCLTIRSIACRPHKDPSMWRIIWLGSRGEIFFVKMQLVLCRKLFHLYILFPLIHSIYSSSVLRVVLFSTPMHLIFHEYTCI